MSDQEFDPALRPPTPTPDDVAEAFKVLAEATQNDVPRLTEQEFVDHLLPMLAAPPGTKVDLTRWLAIAGTPLRCIDVTDLTTGEVLFRLPPLMRSLPTVFQQEVDFSKIVVQAQLRENVHPAQAEQYLRDELAKARTGATFLDVESAKRWNVIRARYGLPLLLIKDEHGNVLDAPTATNGIVESKLSITDDQDDF